MESDQTTDLAGLGTAQLSASSPAELADDDPYVIHGVAIGAGDITVGQTRTRKKWPGDALQRGVATLEGRPLVQNHENTSQGRVGTVTQADYMPGVGVIYEAEIAPHYEELAKDVAAGIQEVSPRIHHPKSDKLEFDEEVGAVIVEKPVFENLSLVDQGAAPSNSAQYGASPDLTTAAGGSEAAEAGQGFDESHATAVLSRSATVPDYKSVTEALSSPDGDDEQTEDAPESTEAPSDDGDTDDLQGESEDSEAGDVDDSPDVTDGSPSTPSVTIASTNATQKSVSELAAYSTTMETIEYEEDVSDEQIEELGDPVVVERGELEELSAQAEQAETVEEELSAVSAKLDEFDEASEVVEELSDEDLELITGDAETEVIESEELSAKLDVLDEVGDMLAEELAQYTPMFEAEELRAKNSPFELYEKMNESEEAELSANIDTEDQTPKSGSSETEELEESETGEDAETEELEEAEREELAQTYEGMGWDDRAEAVRDGEYTAEELGLSTAE